MAPLPGSPALGAGTATGAPATDQRGQPRSGPIDIGAFESPLVISVNTPLDTVGSAPGQITLRQAVNLANALTSEEAIVFTSNLATPQTITLTNGPLVLTDKATTTIAGPGASLLTLSGNNAGRVLDLAGGSAAIQDLTITDGFAALGGGVLNDGGLYNNGTTTLTHVINGNNKYQGGSIALTFVVNSLGVQVTAPGFKSGEVLFTNLNNFSLAAAFANGAIPALVGVSQPNKKSGSARFGSITVTAAPGSSSAT